MEKCCCHCNELNIKIDKLTTLVEQILVENKRMSSHIDFVEDTLAKPFSFANTSLQLLKKMTISNQIKN